MTSNTDR